MKLCIPTVGGGGLASRISPRFWKAPFYTVVDTKTRAVASTRNPRVTG